MLAVHLPPPWCTHVSAVVWRQLDYLHLDSAVFLLQQLPRLTPACLAAAFLKADDLSSVDGAVEK
jgi:hypothetical protein